MSKVADKYLAGLNPQQKKAVLHKQGPILILAGAGTGKTRVLTSRIANLITAEKVYPNKILAVTFTNKATKEMRERLHAMLGPGAEQLWIATFHSTALRILRRHARAAGYAPGFVVYDTDDCKGLVKSILKKQNIDPKKYTPAYYLMRIEQLKNELISPDEFEPLEFEKIQQLEIVYEEYQKGLMQANAMDFTDLIINCLKLLRDNEEIRELYQRTLDYVLVDEFQDTNLVQYEIVKLLTGKKQNLLVVGDDDQSIYAFRGADIRNILSFEEDFPDTEVIKLEQNYRSSNNILSAAYGVISKNKKRKDKKLWTDSGAGEQLKLEAHGSEKEEAEFIAEKILELKENYKLKDIAIFYRTNAQSRSLEEAMLRNNISYRIFGSRKFYERKEIKDILGYLRLIHNPNDNQAFSRIINVPRRGIGLASFKKIVDFADNHGVGYLKAAAELAKQNKKLMGFIDLITTLNTSLLDDEGKAKITISDLMMLVIEETKYLASLNEADPKHDDRKENINELVNIAADFSAQEYTLNDFLDHIALMSSADSTQSNTEEDENNHVSLMTLHIAKGLEFPVVFLTGLEEGILPHNRSIDEGDVSEERRLCYVGITRAKELLYLTYAAVRGFASSSSSFGYGGMARVVSRFVADIPSDVIDSTYIEYEEDEDVDFEYTDEYIDEFNQQEKLKHQKEKKKKLSLDDIIVCADDL